MKKKGVPKGPFYKFLIVDLFVILSALLSAFLITFGELGKLPAENLSVYLTLLYPIMLIRIGCFFAFHLYDFSRGFTSFDLFYYSFWASLISHSMEFLAILYNNTFVTPESEISRSVLILNFTLSFLAASLWRVCYLRRRHRWAYDQTRILIVGAGELGESVQRDINEYSKLGHHVIGLVDDHIENRTNGSSVLGKIVDLEQLVKQHTIDEIIVTSRDANRQELIQILSTCQTTGCKVRLLPELYEVTIGQVEIGQVAGVPLITVDSESQNELQLAIKRLFDTLVASTTLLVFLPAFPLIALVIRYSSKGSIFYRQKRIGKNGVLFSLYKFRTMIDDAESDTGPILSSEDDPRVTRIGRFLRNWHLDEIPQLYNVLRGEMSLVGPRPERPSFARQYEEKIPAYRMRESVLPGMTGLAQIHGFYNSPVEHKLRYDLAYINTMSLLLDVKILSNTLRVTFSKHARISD